MTTALQTYLSEIRARVEKASPAPWKWQRSDLGDYAYVYSSTTLNTDESEPYERRVMDDGSAYGEYSPTIEPGTPNANFIIEARTDIPRLLRIVERAVEALDHQCFCRHDTNGERYSICWLCEAIEEIDAMARGEE